MKLDLSSLGNAVTQLEEGLVSVRLRHRAAIPDNSEPDESRRYPSIRIHLRELSVRMIKRYLEQVSANPAEVDGLDFRTLIRRAREQGLLHSELDAWMGYRANRGITSHTYNEESAERVFQGIPEFLEEARHLLKEFAGKE